MAGATAGSGQRPRRQRGQVRREDAPFVVGQAGADLHRPRRSAHLLLVVIVAFFVIAFAWASHASLEEVTRGDGRVIPSSHVQVVQNLEGGIVADILVREGEIVEAGEVLLRIHDVAAASSFREGRERLRSLLGAIARLEAEVEGRDVLFGDELARDAPDVVRNESALFGARQQALESEIAVLERQVEQRDQELIELRTRIEQLERSLELAKEELAITEPLAAGRVVSKVDLLRLRRQVNDLQGELESASLTIPRVESALLEAEQRIAERRHSFLAEAQRELNTVQAEATGLRESIAAHADRVERTDVRSPVRGTVKRLLVTTVGGVVQPGEDLVEIVPLEDTLLVEARVRPADIAFLHPGQEAVVKVTAYDFSIYGSLDGVVEDISADTITDERGEDFYRIRVRTTDNALKRAGDVLPIIPGMTTQVDILTGKKTVLDYLLKPILRAQDHALRER
ncbi:MAG: HlyD family type I secretion periplasmic adaptor subunit [Geminicoccaceae bacterium]|nr:HlyD family type I secretion periplasmic adaptor subunit [Geminicoccaceae bacterium]